MKYKIVLSSSFKKDSKKLSAQEKNATIKIINILADGKTLPAKYHDHSLIGRLKDYRDCHVKPDLVLIYKIEKDLLIITAYRIASHSELFK